MSDQINNINISKPKATPPGCSEVLVEAVSFVGLIIFLVVVYNWWF